MEEITGVSAQLFGWAMNAELIKQRVAAENIANAHVTGYQAKQVDFSQAMQALSQSGSSTELVAKLAQLEDSGAVYSPSERALNGDGVKLDEEVLASIRASGKYRTLADLLDRQMGLMKIAVKGR
jgi:flagellar basal-body rod protein FlgB